MNGFTDKEKEIFDKITEIYLCYTEELVEQHPSDISEWTDAIHNLQKLLGMRILRREHSDIFPIKKI